MTGIYQHTIDAKGRLFIPARLREELGNKFHVTVSIDTSSKKKCLAAYSKESWERYDEKINMMPRAKQNKYRVFFSRADECVLDGQGRILLVQLLRDWADLKKDVTVVGAGGCVEFWDSETWAAIDAMEATPENIAALFEELDF